MVFGGLVAVVLSGLARVQAAQDVRELYQKLGWAQKQQDELLAEHSRLLLERSAYTSLPNIERVAQSDLGMQFPQNIAQVRP